MRYSQLEALLDSLKGEESVFRLYEQGKNVELKEVYRVFLEAQLYTVTRFNEILANLRKNPSRVVGVKGEKGTGKSTLVSTAVINYYLSGNIDDLRYLRYEPATQKFEELFQVKKHNPKSRVIVVDDIHYFVPDFIGDVFIKGSVTYFDKFVNDLWNIYRLYKDRHFKSVLIYVSDTHSLPALQRCFDKILFKAGRGDLIKLFPKVSGRGTISSSYEIEVDKEFYGKTYAKLRGNIRLYDTANIFGSLIEKETGILTTNPRLLKYLIRLIRKYGRRIDTKLFIDDEIATKIVRGELVNPTEVIDHIYKRASELVKEFYSHLENSRLEAIGALKRLSLELPESQKIFERKFLGIEKSTEKMIKSLERQGKKTDLGEELYTIPTTEDMVKEWEVHAKVASSLSSLISDTSNKIAQPIGSFTKASRNFEYVMRNENIILEKLGRDVERLSRSYRTRLEDVKDGLKSHKKVLEKSKRLDKYPKIYVEVKNWVENFTSKQPILFTTLDTERIKNLLDDPREAIRRINPFTIDVIRNLEILAY